MVVRCTWYEFESSSIVQAQISLYVCFNWNDALDKRTNFR